MTPASKYRLTPLDLAKVRRIRSAMRCRSDADAIRWALDRGSEVIDSAMSGWTIPSALSSTCLATPDVQTANLDPSTKSHEKTQFDEGERV